MDTDALLSLSDAAAALARRAVAKLFHVPSPLGGRTALSFDGKLLLVPAFEAGEGEDITLLAPGGKEAHATVKGFDPSLGLAALELAQALPETAWTVQAGLPDLGSLVLVAAYPSPQGPEVRLDAVRFAGGDGEESYIQTDGSPFPGFAGAALVAPDGNLAGFAAVDKPGNRGWAIPAPRAAALATAIAGGGFPGRAWLGVSTVPVEAPEIYAALFGDDRTTAVMVAGIEERGPAAVAGVLVGDLLVSLGGRAVASPEELRAALEKAESGKTIALVVVRAGARIELEAILASRPEEHPHGWGDRGHRGHWGRGHHGWGWGGMWGCAPGR